MIDYLVVPIIGFKLSGFTYKMVIDFLDHVAVFSFSQDISRNAQHNWWHKVGYEYWPVRGLMHEHFGSLYENPAKMTFSRLLESASTLFKAASSLDVFQVADDNIKIKAIAEICKMTVDANCLSVNADETSTAEHLVHQLMVTGGRNYFYHNENNLLGSAAVKVKFTAGTAGGSVN